MDKLLNLDGRIVVVSGAGGGGIGTTVTRMAAEAGARLWRSVVHRTTSTRTWVRWPTRDSRW